MTTCPFDRVTPDVWQALDAVDDAERGLLPMAGGTLQQTRTFLSAWRFARAEIERWNLYFKERASHG